MKNKSFRVFDLIISISLLVLLSPLFLTICFLNLPGEGSVIFRQRRVGKSEQPFILFKFRTMKKSTPTLPSHEVDSSMITAVGKILRSTKLDELPQLINVIRGDMSLVGPRPGLIEHKELIGERVRLNVYSVLPGITGLAQINKVDMSTPRLLAETDAIMIREMNFKNYLKFIFLTFLGKGTSDATRKSKNIKNQRSVKEN